MGPASELGPVDPQIVFRDQIVPVHHVINSYKQLFEGAEQTTGNIEPYLQQLANYDASMISHLETEQDLATDIAVRYLQNGGMLEGKSERKITEAEERYARMEERIKPFIPQRKEAEWVKREVWRSGSTSPFEPTEHPKADFYATSYR